MFETVPLLFAFSLHVWKVTQLCVCCVFEFWTGRRICHHRHIAFLAMIEDAPLLTKTVKINQSEGIPGSGIPERTFVKNSYKRSRTSLPNPPLLFIAIFTSHRSPLSERLEQASLALARELSSAKMEPTNPRALSIQQKFRFEISEIHEPNGSVHSGCTDPTQATAHLVIVLVSRIQKSGTVQYPK